MATKVIVKYGLDPENAKQTQIILIADMAQGEPPTPDRVPCVDVPLTASDVAVDLLWAWTGICSIEGYNEFAATSYLYANTDPTVALSVSDEDVTHDYSGTAGAAHFGVRGQYIGLRSQSENKTSSMLKFFYPGGAFATANDRVNANSLIGNGLRLKDFYTLYRGVARYCVSRSTPGSTTKEFSVLDPFNVSLYHGVYNG